MSSPLPQLPSAGGQGEHRPRASRVPLFFLLLLLLLVTIGLVIFTSHFLELDRIDGVSTTWSDRGAARANPLRALEALPGPVNLANKTGNGLGLAAVAAEAASITSTSLAVWVTPSPSPDVTARIANGPLSAYLSLHSRFPVVIVCKDRAQELSATLSALLPQTVGNLILILQDGSDRGVQDVADKFGIKRKSRQSFDNVQGGARIAQHYGWTLREGFGYFSDAPAIIVLEDDLTPSPDFMDWFVHASPYLDIDSSLFCVSAWNDNGFAGLAKDPYGVRRTLFFPGLGWLLTREFWKSSLEPRWPGDHWDWFVRGDTMRASRECIIPEMPRVFHAGKRGTFVDEKLQARYFDKINSNRNASISWASPSAQANLKYLPLVDYNARLKRQLERALVVENLATFSQLLDQARRESKPVALFYRADPRPEVENSIMGFCEYFGIWHQIIRASHEAVHEIYYKNVLLYLINVADPRPVHSTWFSPYPHQSIFASLAKHVHEATDFTVRVDRKDPNSITVVSGNKGESCHQACLRMEAGVCILHDLPVINNCDKLRATFSCRECRASEGPDQPALEEGGSCLVNHGQFSCQGSHPSTRRLCACGH